MYKLIDGKEVFEHAIQPVLRDNGLTNVRMSGGTLISKGNPTKELVVCDLRDLTMRVGNDEVVPQLRIYNSFDGSAAFRIMVGCFRWVCWNGLSAGDFLYSQRIIHREGPTADDKLANISERIAATVGYLQSDFNEELNELASVQLTEEQAISVVGSLPVSDRVKARSIYCMVNPRRGADGHCATNLWGMWNNVNESLREKSTGEAAIKANDRLLEDIVLLAKAA